MTPDISKIQQGENQERKVFNTFKRVIRDINLLTDDQIALLHFESWDVAYKRSGKRIAEELLKLEDEK